MDNKAEVREFLMSRRARLSPADVGLTAGSNRRVAGLRRSEVAMLADVSVEYYAKLERGDIAGASSAVLESLAEALLLDATERRHLLDLARTADGIPASGRPRRHTAAQQPARLALQRTLDAITGGPAFIRDRHQNLIATNDFGAAFYSPVIGTGGRTPNLARFQFLDPASRDFYPDWDLFAQMCVGIMRVEAGRDPHDRALQDLVGELSTRSEAFAQLWSRHDVRTHGSGSKRFHHPLVGELTLLYEELAVTSDEGLSLIVYTAEPGSASDERLQLLSNWNAVPPAPQTPSDADAGQRPAHWSGDPE